jgi:hypothetical protein
MEVVSDTQLKPVGDKGFGGYGELMTYDLREDGSVRRVTGPTGARMVPVDEFTLPAKVIRPTR